MLTAPHPARLGDYRLLRRVGVGGMAEVYEAVRGDGPRIALKVLLPDLREDKGVVTGFIDEARIAAELSHPNIVGVHDFGQVDGIYYMAMEFVDGIDLRELIQLMVAQKRTMPVAGCAYIGHELAMGLHYIHTRQRRIIHRDVTPHNVFLTRDGGVKLSDFGVAMARSRLTRTQTGHIKGKLPYLAPEQVRGDPVTERTDVFAMGLLLYEIATGERANRGETDVAQLDQAMNPRFPKPSARVASAAPLDRIVSHALARHPAMRTRDAALLADQLEEILTEQPYDSGDLAQLLAAVVDAQAKQEAALRSVATSSQQVRWKGAPTLVDEVRASPRVTAEAPPPLAALISGEIGGAGERSGEITRPNVALVAEGTDEHVDYSEDAKTLVAGLAAKESARIHVEEVPTRVRSIETSSQGGALAGAAAGEALQKLPTGRTGPLPIVDRASMAFSTDEGAMAFTTDEDAVAFSTDEDAVAFSTDEDAMAFSTDEDAVAFSTDEAATVQRPQVSMELAAKISPSGQIRAPRGAMRKPTGPTRPARPPSPPGAETAPQQLTLSTADARSVATAAPERGDSVIDETVRVERTASVGVSQTEAGNRWIWITLSITLFLSAAAIALALVFAP